MSTEKQKSANRRVKQWLENERRIVTYREVAREFGCHINEAKNLLLSYPSSAYRTYLLAGLLLSTSTLSQTQLPSDQAQLPEKSLAALSATQRVRIVDMDEISEDERNSEDGDIGTEGMGDEMGLLGNDRGDETGLGGKVDGKMRVKIEEEEGVGAEDVSKFGVVLVGEEGFDEKMALFEPGKVTVHIYSLSPAPIRDPAKYLVPNITLRQLPSYHSPEKYGTITGDSFAPSILNKGGAKGMKDGAMGFSAAKKPVAVEEEGIGKHEKKDGVATDPEERKVGAKKPEALASKKVSKEETVKPVTKSTKRVITSDDEEESASAAGPSKAAVQEPTSSAVREADRAAMEAMMSMDMDVEMYGEEDTKPEIDVEATKGEDAGRALKVEPGRNEGTRKRRKVKKSRVEMDTKGYMVTKDYYTDESYSGESELDAEPTSKGKITKKATSSALAKTASRQSSTSNSDAPMERRKPSASATGGGGGASSKPKSAAKPNAGAAKGQSTLAGFFKKR